MKPNLLFAAVLSAAVLAAGCSTRGASAPGAPPAPPLEGLLLEAEAFADPGGWVTDTQFIDIMGSPYLLAHGLGEPVPDAVTRATFPAPGTYRVWARTKSSRCFRRSFGYRTCEFAA